MRDEEWGGAPPVVGVFLNGEEIASPDSRGRQVLDESFLLLFNAHHEDHAFTLPEKAFGERLDAGVRHRRRRGRDRRTSPAGEEVDLVHHSLVLLRRVSE